MREILATVRELQSGAVSEEGGLQVSKVNLNQLADRFRE
jgi:hypothetical protein